MDYLPAYAPELNPVEYVWGYLKNRKIANLCATGLQEVSDFRLTAAAVLGIGCEEAGAAAGRGGTQDAAAGHVLSHERPS